MSRHKTPHLNARNWEDVIEEDGGDSELFEKLRHRKQASDQNDLRSNRGSMNHGTANSGTKFPQH